MDEKRYGERANGRSHGVVNTLPVVVKGMLDLAGYHSDQNLFGRRVIEPAAGTGAFAKEIIIRLYKASLEYQFDFAESLKYIHLFEIDVHLVKALHQKLRELISSFGYMDATPNIHHGDYLTSEIKDADLVVGNPPYVRYDNIPPALRTAYKQKFSTFRYRSDLYIPFFEKALRQLKNGGKLIFICPNRWVNNQYGAPLRQLISRKYQLDSLIDLTGTQPFEESVTAYPAITLLSSPQTPGSNQTSYFRLQELEELRSLEKTLNARSQQSKLKMAGANWTISHETQASAFQDRLCSIESQGYKIGIGVATGCDRVFIGSQLRERIEQDCLLPIISAKDLKGDRFKWQGNYVLNPFDLHGMLIDLEKYPLTKSYLQSNEAILKNRHIARKRPENWYRTIDKIHPYLTQRPKLLLPDISGNSKLFIDEGNYYPHHNLYYITGNDLESLELLAGILMSSFIRNQLKSVSTLMNGGYARWQSQNLRKLRIPSVRHMTHESRVRLKKAYHQTDLQEIDQIISEVLDKQEPVKEAGQVNIF